MRGRGKARSKVYTYAADTLAAAARLYPPATAVVTVNRFDSDSPVAPATYAAVDAEPAHEGKFQDLSGRWWEIQLTCGAVFAAQLGDGVPGVRRAIEITGSIVPTAGYTYDGSAEEPLVILNKDAFLDFRSAKIIRGEEPFLVVRSDWLADVEVLAMNDNVLTVSDGSAFATGLVGRGGLATTPLWHHQRRGLVGEMFRVAGVDGNDITLPEALRHSSVELPPDIEEIALRHIASVEEADDGSVQIVATYPHPYTGSSKLLISGLTDTTDGNGRHEIEVVSSTKFKVPAVPYAGSGVTSGRFRHTFEYSISDDFRVTLFRDDATHIQLGEVYCDPSVESSEGTIVVERRKNAVVNPGWTNYSPSYALKYLCCYNFETDLRSVDSSDTGSGYGIGVNNSEAGTIYVRGGRARHLVDGGGGPYNDPLTGIETTDVSGRGDCYGIRIFAEGVIQGATQAPLDVHHGAEGWEYNGAYIVQSEGGIATRGIRHTYRNGTIEGGTGGFSGFRQHLYSITSISDNGSGKVRVTHGEPHQPFVTGQRMRFYHAPVSTSLDDIYAYVTVINDYTVDLLDVTFTDSTGTNGNIDPGWSYSGELTIDNCRHIKSRVRAATVCGWRNKIRNLDVENFGPVATSVVEAGGEVTIMGGIWNIRGSLTNREIGISHTDADLTWDGTTTIFAGTVPSRIVDARDYPRPVKATNLVFRNPNGALDDFIGAASTAPAGSELGNIRVTGLMTGTWFDGVNDNTIKPYVVGPLQVGTQIVARPGLFLPDRWESVTVDTGVITVTSSLVTVDTSGGNVDLYTINVPSDTPDGALFYFRIVNSSRRVTFKNYASGSDNISVGADRLLSSSLDIIVLIWDARSSRLVGAPGLGDNG